MHEIDPERPIYGVQASGITEPAPLPASIEAMAHDYAAAIRKVQPTGPYYLLGWSFGGLVAHAMACRLQQEGAEVAVLALMDCYPLGERDKMPPWNEEEVLDGLVTALAFDRTEMNSHSLDVPAFLEAVRRAGHVLGCLDEEQGRRFLGLLRDSRRLVRAFRPGRFEGDMLFFAATEAEAVAINWATAVTPNVWSSYVSGHLHVHDISCATRKWRIRLPSERSEDFSNSTYGGMPAGQERRRRTPECCPTRPRRDAGLTNLGGSGCSRGGSFIRSRTAIGSARTKK